MPHSGFRNQPIQPLWHLSVLTLGRKVIFDGQGPSVNDRFLRCGEWLSAPWTGHAHTGTEQPEGAGLPFDAQIARELPVRAWNFGACAAGGPPGERQSFGAGGKSVAVSLTWLKTLVYTAREYAATASAMCASL